MESCTAKSRTAGTGLYLVFGLTLFSLALGQLANRQASPNAPSKYAQWNKLEIARIQKHLAGAERLLLDADISLLSPDQLRARQANISLLHEYLQSGRFPRNLDFRGERRPCFVDDRGVHCAMAHLLAQSGRRDIVERVRASNNYAYIRELASDTALVAWLASAGLSLDDAALIQPQYEYFYYETVSTDYAVISASASLVNGAVIAWNLTAPSSQPIPRERGLIGVMAGGASIILGASHFDDPDNQPILDGWNIALGSLTAGLGLFTLFRSGPDSSTGDAAPSSEPSGSNEGVQLSLSPLVGEVSGARLQLDF